MSRFKPKGSYMRATPMKREAEKSKSGILTTTDMSDVELRNYYDIQEVGPAVEDEDLVVGATIMVANYNGMFPDPMDHTNPEAEFLMIKEEHVVGMYDRELEKTEE